MRSREKILKLRITNHKKLKPSRKKYRGPSMSAILNFFSKQRDSKRDTDSRWLKSFHLFEFSLIIEE